MNEELDIKSMTAAIPTFVKIDKIVDDFFTLLNEKNILPKSISDLERVERFFNVALNDIKKEVSISTFEPEDKELLKSKLTMDFYAKLADESNLPLEQVPMGLGSWNLDNFQEEVKNLAKYM